MQTIEQPVNPAVGATTRKPRRRIFSALLLIFTGVLGLNVYVFSQAPLRTPHYGFAEVRQIFSDSEALDAHRPARAD